MTSILNDTGFLLAVYPVLGRGATVSVFTKKNGLISGFVRGKIQDLQIGNLYSVSYYARLEEQLGSLKLELYTSFQNVLLFQQMVLSCFNLMRELCLICLPEKTPFSVVFDNFLQSFKVFSENQSKEEILKTYFLFEICFLSESGFGLSLSHCALTGARDDLYYLSPKTGCAATREAGQAYSDNLFVIPSFFIHPENVADEDDLKNAFLILGYFLQKAMGESLSSFFKKRSRLL